MNENENKPDTQQRFDLGPGSAVVSAPWKWLLLPSIQIALILLVGFSLYLNTFYVPFMFDDHSCITDNPAIRNFDYFFDFEKMRQLDIYEDIKNSFALRPVAYLTFALNYKFGGLNVFGYHLVNTIIHLCNAVLIYLLTTVTLQQAPLRKSGNEAVPLSDLLPLLVALLFVAHPLQTQAVTYISQRFASLATFFYFAAFLLYIFARMAQTSGKRWLCYGFSLLLTIVAMKTKGIAFTLPVMMFLYDIFFLPGKLKQRVVRIIPFVLTMVIIPGTLIWLVATDGVNDPRWKVDQAVNMVNFSKISNWDYLKTQFGVVVSYLRMLVVPVKQNMVHDYPMAQSFFEPKIFCSFLLLLTLFGAALQLALRSFRSEERFAERLIAFGILWFFITISITSSFIPLDFMKVEYRVYLPSFGAFLAVTVIAAAAVDRGFLSRRIFIGIAAVVIILLGAATVVRNNLYTDRIRLMEDIVAKSPARLEPRLGLAFAYLQSQRFEDAIREYTWILQKLPNDTNMIVNLGYSLQATGQINEAMAQYRRAIALNPYCSYAHGNLGIAYLGLNLVAAAEQELKTALVNDPDYVAARNGLAKLYEQQGRIAEAIDQYRALQKSYPGNPEVAEQLRRLRGG